jgi:glyoxylase-like metal-dependent hydrolase (beta-lactamase superfamily II)
VTISDDETAVAVLAKKNIAPSDISYIIITHFHADHICALRDFPAAKYICSREALAEAVRLKSWRAVSKGIVKALLPEDFDKRVLLIEDIAATSGVVDGGIQVKSFFDESLIQFAYLPGHATGMVGLIIRNGQETIFYAADAQWDKAVFDAGILPKRIVKLFFSSWKDFLDTTRKLKLYMAANPTTKLLFTHCEQTLKYVQCRLS